MLHKIVYYASGEIQGTYSPKCYLESFTGDLQETTTRLLSHDMWEPVKVDMYVVREFDVPEFFTEQDFLNNYISLTFMRGLGCEPESLVQFYNLDRLGERYQYFIGWFFKKKKLNSYTQSIKDQLMKWLNESEHKYQQPLSQKQFEAVTRYCPLYNAKKISNNIYWSFNR